MAMTFVPVTIPAGESISETVDCTSSAVAAMFMPDDWSPANLTFQVSYDNVSFFELVSVEGSPVMAACKAGTCMPVFPEVTACAVWLRIRSGTLEHPEAQKIDRTFVLAMNAAGGSASATSAGILYEFTSNFLSVDEPPTDAHIKFDNLDQTLATMMWVDNHVSQGTDIRNVFLPHADDELYLQDKTDATKYQVYKVTADPVSKDGYVEIPVAWARGGGIPIANNQKVMLGII